MQFPPRFVKWITSCISTTMFSVKLNGALCDYFEGKRGLRQGDPLSPYVFALVMNTLSTMLDSKGEEFKHHWRCKPLDLTHLFFAENVLLFCHGDKNSIAFIMNTVNKFSRISGLLPNCLKSHVFFSNCSEEVTSWFNDHYSIPTGSLPVRFLGVPLISSQLTFNNCVPLLQKLTRRINCWTSILLSFAGRLQLLRAVLFAIQSFWTAHFILPKLVLKNIVQILTRFLWKGNTEDKGGAKIAWQSICKPKAGGGLGAKDPTEWNKSQILFRLWLLVVKHDSLWVRWAHASVLRNKYFWSVAIPVDCSWIWRKVLQLRPLACRFIKFIIGNGRDISLWFSPWFKGQCLSNTRDSAIIHASRLPPTSTVADLIYTGYWVLPPTDHHHCSDLTSWVNAFDYLMFDLTKPDTIRWVGIPCNKVTTREIWDSIRAHNTVNSWHKCVWNKVHVPRYTFLSWLLCHERLPTLARLARFDLVCSTQCLLCIAGVESQNHLMVECPYSRFILNQLLKHFILLPFTNWMELVNCFEGIQSGGLKHVFGLVIQTYSYHIWRERNFRKHGKCVLGPKAIMEGIMIDVKGRLASSQWFAKQVVKNPETYYWLRL